VGRSIGPMPARILLSTRDAVTVAQDLGEVQTALDIAPSKPTGLVQLDELGGGRVLVNRDHVVRVDELGKVDNPQPAVPSVHESPR
jgi:hypothetical protein